MSVVDTWLLLCEGRTARAWMEQDYTVLGLIPTPGVGPREGDTELALQDLGGGTVAFQIGNGVNAYASMRDDYSAHPYQLSFQVPGSSASWITNIGGDETFKIVPTGDGYFALQCTNFGLYVGINPVPNSVAGCNALYGVSTDMARAARFSAVGSNQASILSIITVSGNANGLSFRGVDLSGRTVDPGVDLTLCDFRGVLGLKGASLAGTKLNGAVFSGLQLGGLGLSGADCTDADFTGAGFAGFVPGTPPPILTGATFTGATIPAGVTWTGAKMSNAVLAGADLTGTDLSGPTTDLSGANLGGVGVTRLVADYTGGSGIAGFDMSSPADRVLAYDYGSTGHLDHLVCYRPGQGRIVIAERRAAGAYAAVYPRAGDGPGIGGFSLSDPADQIVTVDWTASGKLDHLLCYRPGGGLVTVLAKGADGSFSSVFSSSSGLVSNTGANGFPLTDTRDRIIAYAWAGDGKPCYLLCTRPGTGLATILLKDETNPKQTTFSPLFHSSTGIGGWDLGSAHDQVIAYDCPDPHTGTDTRGLDHVVCYRPGTGGIAVLARSDQGFTTRYIQGDPGSGIADFPLDSPTDRIIAYDHAGTGRLDHLLCYRPGMGVVRILATTDGTSFTIAYDAPGGIAGYDFMDANDLAVAVDPTGSGKLGGLVLCRPGAGTAWVVLQESPGPATLTGSRLGGTNLAGADLAGCDLREPASLRDAILSGAHLRGATLTGVDLTGANLAGTDLSGCDLSRTTFSTPFTRSTDPSTPTLLVGCTVPYSVLGLDWSCLDLTDATIPGLPTVLTGLHARGLRWPNGDFTGFVLDGADLSSAVLDGALFTQAKLRANGTTQASFAGSRLMGTSFTEAVLVQTVFTNAALGGTSSSESSADFSFAFLDSCDFTGAALDGALFPGATLLSGNVLSGTSSMYAVDFSGAYLAGADLTNATLTGATFDFACLVGVVLRGADLTPFDGAPASLESAFLQGVDFTGTKLGGTSMPNAVVTNSRGSVQVQYYDQSGNLTPARPLNYAAKAFPAATSFTDKTTCPNGRTYRTNLNAHPPLTIAQMMTIKNPPTSWAPKSNRPVSRPGAGPGVGRDPRPQPPDRDRGHDGRGPRDDRRGDGDGHRDAPSGSRVPPVARRPAR